MVVVAMPFRFRKVVAKLAVADWFCSKTCIYAGLIKSNRVEACEHSDFDEFTMLSSGNFAPYIGFSEAEVKALSGKYNQDYEKVKKWYDGYWLNDYQVYNPKAVVSVMLRGEFKSYWSETASYETDRKSVV